MAGEQKESPKKSRLPKKWKPYLLRIIVFVGLFLFAFRGSIFGPDPHTLTQTELIQKARQGQVAEVVYTDDTHLTVKLKDDARQWEVTYPKALADDTFRGLAEAKVNTKPLPEKGFPWGSLLTFIWLMLLASLFLNSAPGLLKRLQAKLKGQTVHSTRPAERFQDVKGVPEVVTELTKIANILRQPERYKKLGARMPAGVVLYGPPGTGKTMLAKALAGEAGVPYYEITGSSIRSKWIGEASKAIRAYFEKARRNPVSIIFFDEGDTLGGRRSDSTDGGHQEHRATVNELLAQMNPGRQGGTVFVVIATNDPELLDEALTRPGRIDLKLAVLPPDVNGRRAILEAHTHGKPLAQDTDLVRLAKETYGFNGAGLEALVNNAALEAGERGANAITMGDFEHALTVMNAGPVRKGHVTEHDKRVTACHEAGHALCAAVQDKVANPTSVTILAHGYSGGHTRSIPDEEEASQYTSREAAKQELTMCMGGLVGEKLALNADFTNGAASDRKQATDLAIKMVCRWGMGTYNSSFDTDWRNGPHADEVWRQVEDLLDEAERAALDLVLRHKAAFDALWSDLLEKETLRASDLQGYHPQAVSDEEFEDLKQQYKEVYGTIHTRTANRATRHIGHRHTAHLPA